MTQLLYEHKIVRIQIKSNSKNSRTANILIGTISDLGMRSTHYFCSGALMFSIFYFVSQRECGRKNNPDDESNLSVSKVLMRTWDNKFDWHSMLVIIFGSVI